MPVLRCPRQPSLENYFCLQTAYGRSGLLVLYPRLRPAWPYHVTVVSAATHEAPYLLDGLLHHGTRLEIDTYYTDTGGATDHIFALCRMLGFRFSPRLREITGLGGGPQTGWPPRLDEPTTASRISHGAGLFAPFGSRMVVRDQSYATCVMIISPTARLSDSQQYHRFAEKATASRRAKLQFVRSDQGARELT